MWDNIGPKDSNTCRVCLLRRSNMCPKPVESIFSDGKFKDAYDAKDKFVGRYMQNPEGYFSADTCHRFLLDPFIRNQRYFEIMKKLKTNIE